MHILPVLVGASVAESSLLGGSGQMGSAQTPDKKKFKFFFVFIKWNDLMLTKKAFFACLKDLAGVEAALAKRLRLSAPTEKLAPAPLHL